MNTLPKYNPLPAGRGNVIKTLYAIVGIGHIALAVIIAAIAMPVGFLLATHDDNSGILLAVLGLLFGLGPIASGSFVLVARGTIVNDHVDEVGARRTATRARGVALALSVVGAVGMIASVVAPVLMEVETKIAIGLIAIPTGVISVLVSWSAFLLLRKQGTTRRG